ncbi:MAG TPA: hypothetical protein VK738_15520 [Terriglobales bacterium]|jgi:hypothetical protein|nr:hypothetical protein [Terriglobales bacterium]
MRNKYSLYEHRVINGLLKANPQHASASAVRNLLRRNIELVVDPTRLENDLWPCVWAMASALARQFFGIVHINCGLKSALSAPVPLPQNCVFSRPSSVETICIGVGTTAPGCSLIADARGNRIAFGRLITESREPANPISCFAIAGYVAFAALAQAVEIPPFRDSFSVAELALPYGTNSAPIDGLTLIGLGQLGQAYLSLLYFLHRDLEKPALFLIDKDQFEPPNRYTQILLSGDDWRDKRKAEYIKAWAKSAGFPCEANTVTINWGWRIPVDAPGIALLGLDSLDVRRMCASAGFDWLIEAGVGTSLAKPRVTWHSFPPDATVARRLFDVPERTEEAVENARYVVALKKSPGNCGWVSFKNIKATAPSLGLVAAAYAFSELLLARKNSFMLSTGSAYLWSPLLPCLRNPGNASVN